MFTFIYYILTLRWTRAYRHLNNTPEELEMELFEELGPQLFNVKPAYTFSRKQVLKDIKKAYDSTVVLPCGLSTHRSKFEQSTPEEFADIILNNNGGYEPMYIGGAMKDRINLLLEGAHHLQTAHLGALIFHSFREYRWIETPMDSVRSTLTTSWIKAQTLQGKIPKECSNCESDISNSLDEDLDCNNCGYAIDINMPIPTSLTKLWKEVAEYEKSSGREVIDRTKQAA